MVPVTKMGMAVDKLFYALFFFEKLVKYDFINAINNFADPKCFFLILFLVSLAAMIVYIMAMAPAISWYSLHGDEPLLAKNLLPRKRKKAATFE